MTSSTPSAPSAPSADLPISRPLRFLGLAWTMLLVLLTTTIFGIAGWGSKYVFKDQLHLDPDRISLLSLLINSSWYISSFIGLFRDRWRPFGPYDRLTLALSTLLSAICTLIAGAITPHTSSLLLLMFLYTAGAVIANVVLTGQLAAISKHLGLTGRTGALLIVIPCLANGAMGALTGFLIQYYGWPTLCYVSAAISLTAFTSAIYQPRSLIAFLYTTTPDLAAADREPVLVAVRRLFSHREVILTAIISALWCFTPGWGTPLLFHLTEHVKLSQSQFEFAMTAEKVVNGLTALLYMFLCTRYAARSLLYFGLSVGAIGFLSYALVKDYRTAFIVSAWYGATSGIGNAAVNDLMFRATPRHLEAVAAMLATTAMTFFTDISDLVGSLLYEHGGFVTALIVTTVVNILMLPIIAFVPARVFAEREGTPIDDRPTIA